MTKGLKPLQQIAKGTALVCPCLASLACDSNAIQEQHLRIHGTRGSVMCGVSSCCLCQPRFTLLESIEAIEETKKQSNHAIIGDTVNHAAY
ncbi:hypothetical protein ASPBRDRAFT_41227 [Aspergillus brasiliensis CBS 101740]|uniref:Uncharacterized protein n=1 Tax=Aspergillus brasiliensis (strain CBS 101740 / IMI 381727 / IBT 21946) TaxID=767769 RepID=A0A1L9UP70_ASPBC|nr:hypothetical protein ASPBRDRAFT_41227 [Aspergillus brasiliensis CBS 101740]